MSECLDCLPEPNDDWVSVGYKPTPAVPAAPELDLVKEGWVPICVDNAGTLEQWYQMQESVFNNTDETRTDILVYLDPTGTRTATAPTGTITVGTCPVAVEPNILSNVLCDGDTKVLVLTTVNGGVPTNTYFDLATGATWTGDPATLVACPDNDTESDPKEMCDDGTTAFVRWYVKKNGQPTGVYFDTAIDGTAYTPTNPSFGNCSTPQQVLADHNNGCIETTTPNLPGDPIIAHVPAKQVVTYDVAGTPVTDKYYEQSTLAEITFNPATDVFKNNCEQVANDIEYITGCDVQYFYLTINSTYAQTTSTDIDITTNGGVTGIPTVESIEEFIVDFGQGTQIVVPTTGTTVTGSFAGMPAGTYTAKVYVQTKQGAVISDKAFIEFDGNTITNIAIDHIESRAYCVKYGPAIMKVNQDGTTEYFDGRGNTNNLVPLTLQGLFTSDCDYCTLPKEEIELSSKPVVSSTSLVSEVLTPADGTGTYLGTVVRVERLYDANGVLVSENYYDTVTGAVVTLPAGTVQLIPVADLDTETVTLCDDNGPFIRNFHYFPGGQLAYTHDTDLNGNPYTVVGAAVNCDTLPIVNCGGSSPVVVNGVYDSQSVTFTGEVGTYVGSPTVDLTAYGTNLNNSLVIDGATWNYLRPKDAYITVYLNDGESTIDLQTQNPVSAYSMPNTFSLATDPSGNTISAALLSNIITGLATLGIPYSNVMEITHTVTGSQFNGTYRVELTTPNTSGPYVNQITTTNGNYSFSYTGPSMEADYLYDLSTIPATATINTVSIEIVANIPSGDTLIYGLSVGGASIYYSIASGNGSLTSYTLNIPISGNDIIGNPYTLTATSLVANTKTFIYDQGSAATQIDGLKLNVNYTYIDNNASSPALSVVDCNAPVQNQLLTDINTSITSLTGTVTAESNQQEVLLGQIATSLTPFQLQSGGYSIASGSFAAGLGPDGTAWNNPGNLRSITVVARESNTTDANPGSGANQVIITTSLNKFVLLTGESYTWSVLDKDTVDFMSVEAVGDAAAGIAIITL